MSVHRHDQIVVVLIFVLDWPDYDEEDDDDVPPEPPGKDACPTLNTYETHGYHHISLREKRTKTDMLPN